MPESVGVLFPRRSSAVLIAPPGAGKTTAVAPALLDQPWCTGQIWLLSPRRVAARAAAERMAELLAEQAGETVGYLTRLDTKQSANTRILVMTEAIFVNRIVADPELEEVSAVLFDEAHERHLDSDLGLALALETQQILRDDLRILVMSATIDGERFSDLMGPNAPVIESEGKSYPLQVEWFGGDPTKRLEDHVSSAVLVAWRAHQGDVLVFLPGVGEISRTQERLAALLPDALILPLHGQIPPAGQRAAIRRDPKGRRRIVLATAIAETSLTLDGVAVVVDAGLSRLAEYDRASGTSHLVTRRASQAAATQRAGRAARQGPGVAYRLWEQGGHAGRPAYAPPEIETADLAPLMLSLAKWGTSEPNSLQWLDPPPEASVAVARNKLQTIGALSENGQITDFGQRISELPLDPAIAAAVLFGAKTGQADEIAKLALLSQERGLGGRSEDIAARLLRWNGDRSARASAARKLASGWARKASKLVGDTRKGQVEPVIHLARALPDRIAKRRSANGEDWISAGGRGFRLEPTSPLAGADWLVVLDAQGQSRGARITAALALDDGEVHRSLADLIETSSVIHWNDLENRVEARKERRLGAIKLTSGPDAQPDMQAIVDKLVEKAAEKLETMIPGDLLARGNFAAVEALSINELAASVQIWLVPLLNGKRSLDLPAGKVAEAILNQLDWPSRQRLDAVAPRHFTSPAGTTHSIDYSGDDAPSVEVRAQALFSLDQQPMIGNVPLLLKLTSPAGRPIQATRDLPGFWRGSWADVVKDMKGRYPKHRWPTEPWNEKPSLKTKNAFSRDGFSPGDS